MKKIIPSLMILILCSFNVAAQELNEVLTPIGLDKSVLSGIGLKKINIKDEPEKDFYQKNYTGVKILACLS